MKIMNGVWRLIKNGYGLTGTWVPLDWKRRIALGMIGGGIIGFVAGILFSHAIP
jgi:hypothetical protein